MSNYAKHKERLPEDTVFKIQSILHDEGIFTSVDWVDEEYDGVCSNRVSIYPLQGIGQNGKGTDERYALASGYAELMERMQNGWLGQKLHGREVDEWEGFIEAPDERLMLVSEIVDQRDPFLLDLFLRLGLILRPQQEAFLRDFCTSYYHRQDDRMPVLPYVDVFGNRIVWLPFVLITLFALSNGMAAGNTLEEALVQGFSEVYERHVLRELIARRVTPPEIPREDLRSYDFWDLVERIEASGRYRVSVRDASLGEGYPVCCTIIADQEKGTFGMRLGCHPSLAVAVERTLTEAFQGKQLATFASGNRTGTRDETGAYHNVINIAKLGYGACPLELLAGDPDWSYDPRGQWGEASNQTYLAKLLAHAKSHGHHPLVRDCSHMGFPSYHVVIPSIHDVYPVGGTRVREFRTQLKCAESLCHFPQLSAKEEERLLDYARFKSNSLEWVMGLTLMNHLVGDLYAQDRMVAFVALKRGRYAMAAQLFRKLESEAPAVQKTYWACLLMLAELLNDGVARDAAYDHLDCLFKPEVAQRVRYETMDAEAMLERVFPHAMRCFDCESCELAGTHCEYPEASLVYKKIKTAMAKGCVSQEALQQELRKITIDIA